MSARLSDVLDAYLEALEAGTAPARETLLKQHPDIAEELAATLDGLDFVHRAARTLAGPGDDAAPGKSLGDYRLVREIGRGGMAVVYEAEQVSLGRRVALKVLPFAAVLDPKQLQRFKNEALAAAHLRHPNIVPVHGVGSERGVHYYAMQYVEGQSLAHAIGGMRGGGAGEGRGTPISSHGSNMEPAYVRMAAALGVQAAEALDHAHELGIVHRDVKPGNLLVDLAGTLWITDFGLARSHQDVGLTMTGEILGTIRYMSPEQALAKRVPVDHRTDVYSLGATLYELLTLEPAFPGDDPHAVIQDIATKEPVPPRKLNPALPRDLETVLLKAMSKDPAGRYATAQEMADDLGRCLEDKPILARRPSVAARAARWSRRHRKVVAASFVALLVLVAALVVDNLRVARALRRADTNLTLARKAVNKFLIQAGVTNLEEKPLPPKPTLELLEAALEFYESNLDDDPTSFHNRIFILHALHRYEDILRFLDRVQASRPGDVALMVERGHTLEHLDRHAEALSCFDEALRIDPGDARGHVQRGIVLMSLRRGDEALQSFDRALVIDPDYRAAHANRSTILLEKKRPDEALAAADRYAALAPGDARGHVNRGGALHALRRYADALVAYDRAASLDPNYSRAHAGRSFALRALGRNEEALAAANRAIEIDPGYAPNHDARANALGLSKEALSSIDRAIEIDPGQAKYHYLRGIVLASLGGSTDAVAAIDRAIEIAPNWTEPHAIRALVLNQLGRSADALAAASRAIALDPDNALAHGTRANALHSLGRIDEAVAAYREAARVQPRSADARCELGGILLEIGDRKGAAEAYLDAIRVDPNNAASHLGLGDAVWNDDPERAIAQYREAIRLDPKLTKAHRQLGVALLEKREAAGAIVAFREAVRLEPDLAGTHCDLGKALAESGDLDGAIDEYREAIRLDAGLAAAHSNLGAALRARGDPAGVDAMREAARLAPDMPEVHFNLGFTFLEDGDYDGAIGALAEAVRLRPDFAAAHWNLGIALCRRERFREALPHLRWQRELVADSDSAELQEWTEYAERKVDIEDRLDQWLSGAARPRDANERVAFATRLHERARYAEAARMWMEAFSGEAALAADLDSHHRYNAACSAALAGGGGGADAAEWRARALEWLRADLEAREKAGLAETLKHWKGDADLAGVRDRVDELPEPERAAWRGLWESVDAVLAAARAASR